MSGLLQKPQLHTGVSLAPTLAQKQSLVATAIPPGLLQQPSSLSVPQPAPSPAREQAAPSLSFLQRPQLPTGVSLAPSVTKKQTAPSLSVLQVHPQALVAGKARIREVPEISHPGGLAGGELLEDEDIGDPETVTLLVERVETLSQMVVTMTEHMNLFTREFNKMSGVVLDIVENEQAGAKSAEELRDDMFNSLEEMQITAKEQFADLSMSQQDIIGTVTNAVYQMENNMVDRLEKLHRLDDVSKRKMNRILTGMGLLGREEEMEEEEKKKKEEEERRMRVGVPIPVGPSVFRPQ